MKPTSGSIIVYVDDEHANRLVFEQSFGNRFRIVAVTSGEEALEVLKGDSVAVLVTDQRMPGMSGHELLTRCKALYPQVIRVVITAYSDLDPILAAINEGLVARYLVKPWKRSELEEILAWGVAAFELGQRDSTLQLRLLQTERLATIGTLSAAILHDLNQPLVSVLINSDRIIELAAAAPIIARWLENTQLRISEAERLQLADLASDLPEVAADVVHSCKLLREITGSLRRFLSPGPTVPGAPPAANPTPVIQYALRVSKHMFVEAHAQAIYDGPAELPRVRMDSTELSQVFINVVANAAQALLLQPKGGGQVVVYARDEGPRVRFWVEDNGPGIPPEALKKVGTQFFSTRQEGTGLGISQCRRLVGAAGGEFKIESEPERGTRVTILVPKSDAP